MIFGDSDVIGQLGYLAVFAAVGVVLVYLMRRKGAE